MDLTLIIKIVIMILTAIGIYFVIPFLKAKTTSSELESLIEFVTVGVRAAEMMYKETGMGAKKKEYVVEYLKELGYEVDVNEIDAMIEGAVFDLKNSLE